MSDERYYDVDVLVRERRTYRVKASDSAAAAEAAEEMDEFDRSRAVRVVDMGNGVQAVREVRA